MESKRVADLTVEELRSVIIEKVAYQLFTSIEILSFGLLN
jgi:hypothetical protein